LITVKNSLCQHFIIAAAKVLKIMKLGRRTEMVQIKINALYYGLSINKIGALPLIFK
jgi:hypothetical protein